MQTKFYSERKKQEAKWNHGKGKIKIKYVNISDYGLKYQGTNCVLQFKRILKVENYYIIPFLGTQKVTASECDFKDIVEDSSGVHWCSRVDESGWEVSS